MRYFIEFSYDGAAYHGWQVQPNAHTVQQELNRALSLLLGMPVETTGAGRTDAKVNALKMVAHFDSPAIENPDQLCYRLNQLLPADISISGVRQVADEAHARFDATERAYYYYVYHRKHPFRRAYAFRAPYRLDYAQMNRAAAMLLTVDDFSSFCKAHSQAHTHICHVRKAEWTMVEDDLWRFEIRADRFLRNMVRAIVGTLIDVGRGKIGLDEFEAIIHQKDRCAAAESVPGEALFLADVVYPY
ncbi:MAG: tRNA pseudouridine(38-40) synthase TruA [Alloprevotella sp.]|nr:tRNA pseudouridine(38-40) synthase TruA [Alloprevotella sp.]